MTYLISYLWNNEQRTTEWIVPEGWSTATITAIFEERYPPAQAINLEPQP